LKLISQFKLTHAAAVNSCHNFDIYDFIKSYKINVPLGVTRLLEDGVPATTVHQVAEEKGRIVLVQDATEKFITAMDAIRLGQSAVDELQPVLGDLMDALTKLPDLPKDFESTKKVHDWLIRLNKMRAAEEITEDDSRQLSHDLDVAYTVFRRYLNDDKR